MKRAIIFFLFATLAGALAHYLICLLVSWSGGGSGFVGFIFLWILSLPMKYVILSPFGQSLSPLPYDMLFIANSLLWGLMLGTAMLWWKHNHE